MTMTGVVVAGVHAWQYCLGISYRVEMPAQCGRMAMVETGGGFRGERDGRD
jgi:hypothetical protein